MDVLITGGNGFVGRHLIDALHARGDSVRVLALPNEDVQWLDAHDVDVYLGDVCRPDTLNAPMRGADAIVHLAAMMHVWRPLADYRAVNVTGTQNVCNAALTASVERVVHMSSSSVYGMAQRPPVDENCPMSPFADPYPISKAEGDKLVRRMMESARLRAVIVRPDQIFGPGDHLHFGHMADRLQARRSIVVGRGNNRLPLVYVSDLVQALLLALDHPHALGHAFNISAATTMTQRDFLDAIAAEIGAPLPRARVNAHLLYAAAFAAEKLAAASHGSRRPPITRLGVAFLASDVRYSIDKARHRLGYEPQVSLREGVRRTAGWYLNANPSAEKVKA